MGNYWCRKVMIAALKAWPGEGISWCSAAYRMSSDVSDVTAMRAVPIPVAATESSALLLDVRFQTIFLEV